MPTDTTPSSGTKNSRQTPTTRQAKKRKGLWTALAIAGAVIIAVAVMAIPVIAGGPDRSALIRVPAGATEQQLADSLTKYFGSDYALHTMRVIKGMNREISSRHGAYLIEEGTSPLQAARKIMRGTQTPVRLTINGFRMLPTLADRISRKMDFTPDSLISALYDDATLQRYGVTREQAIGIFIDDSYDVYWSESPQQVIDKIGAHYLSVWNDKRRAQAEQLGLTPAEVMTICSIVDEETNKTDEKGAIGRLYINRLRKGMRLQADPTVRYALGDFTIKRVAGAMLSNPSPYNTYHTTGLPPGPIRTTSVATIDAVLSSEPHDYIYMCARPDFSGYHDFASDYDSHLSNARAYQAALDRLGITSAAQADSTAVK